MDALYYLIGYDVIQRFIDREIEKSDKTLIPYGFKVFSQNDEDGIIEEIFNRIGTTNKIFVEFGVSSGLETNTLLLLHKGWHGVWIEQNENDYNRIAEEYKIRIKEGRLFPIKAGITCENINSIIEHGLNGLHDPSDTIPFPDKEIDFLSVDIDGNDIHVLEVLTVIKPRVICVEYNAKFPPSVKYCRRYDPLFMWSGDDNYGASLSYMQDALKDYSIVGVNITGTNAFFVKDTALVSDMFYFPGDVGAHYLPQQYFMPYYPGHKTSYGTLRDAIL